MLLYLIFYFSEANILYPFAAEDQDSLLASNLENHQHTNNKPQNNSKQQDDVNVENVGLT